MWAYNGEVNVEKKLSSEVSRRINFFFTKSCSQDEETQLRVANSLHPNFYTNCDHQSLIVRQ